MTVASPFAEQLARLPVTHRVLPVRGSDTHVWEYGEAGTDEGRSAAATAIVVVHGFRGDHHGLEPVVAQLGAPGLRIIAPDLPGFGDSTPLHSPDGAIGAHDVPGYSAWLRDLVEAIRRESPEARIVVLGHSFGSIVVSATLATPPGLDVDDCILINPISAPALSGPRGVMTRLAIGYYRFAAAVPEKLGFAILRSALVVRIMSLTMTKTRERGLRRWIHNQHDRYFSAFANRDVVLQSFRASVSNDVSEFAARITAPTLLIASDKDDITPVQAQYEIVEAFPDARLVVLGGVGHLIHYERPVEAAEAITAFLERTE